MSRFAVAALALFTLVAPPVHAQGYPDHGVRILVPVPARAVPADALTRIAAEQLSAALGQPFVVENKPGAGGNIGMEQGARAAARRLHADARAGRQPHGVAVHLREAAVRPVQGLSRRSPCSRRCPTYSW
jgi:tripartite-type tricarboxylate transporter receptor subunit TctC